jgi:hypothetical protein
MTHSCKSVDTKHWFPTVINLLMKTWRDKLSYSLSEFNSYHMLDASHDKSRYTVSNTSGQSELTLTKSYTRQYLYRKHNFIG